MPNLSVRPLKKTFCWMFFHRILFSISLYLFGTSRLSEVIILANIIFKVNNFFYFFVRIVRIVRVVGIVGRVELLDCHALRARNDEIQRSADARPSILRTRLVPSKLIRR